MLDCKLVTVREQIRSRVLHEDHKTYVVHYMMILGVEDRQENQAKCANDCRDYCAYAQSCFSFSVVGSKPILVP